MGIIRHSDVQQIDNGFPIARGNAGVNVGQDYAIQSIRCRFTAADIGTAAGQTRHANGMIFAEFEGGRPKSVLFSNFSKVSGTYNENDIYAVRIDATHIAPVRLQFKIINTPLKSTVIIHDASALAESQIVAGDEITAVISVGTI